MAVHGLPPTLRRVPSRSLHSCFLRTIPRTITLTVAYATSFPVRSFLSHRTGLILVLLSPAMIPRFLLSLRSRHYTALPPQLPQVYAMTLTRSVLRRSCFTVTPPLHQIMHIVFCLLDLYSSRAGQPCLQMTLSADDVNTLKLTCSARKEQVCTRQEQ
jgi:hypothetical protein